MITITATPVLATHTPWHVVAGAGELGSSAIFRLNAHHDLHGEGKNPARGFFYSNEPGLIIEGRITNWNVETLPYEGDGIGFLGKCLINGQGGWNFYVYVIDQPEGRCLAHTEWLPGEPAPINALEPVVRGNIHIR